MKSVPTGFLLPPKRTTTEMRRPTFSGSGVRVNGGFFVLGRRLIFEWLKLIQKQKYKNKSVSGAKSMKIC